MIIFGQPFFIIYSRWVRVKLKGFYERGIVYPCMVAGLHILSSGFWDTLFYRKL
jgi:hypothetical protein